MPSLSGNGIVRSAGLLKVSSAPSCPKFRPFISPFTEVRAEGAAGRREGVFCIVVCVVNGVSATACPFPQRNGATTANKRGCARGTVLLGAAAPSVGSSSTDGSGRGNVCFANSEALDDTSADSIELAWGCITPGEKSANNNEKKFVEGSAEVSTG
jgi:hypothetical protein